MMHRQKIHIECTKKDRARADVIEILQKIIKNEFSGIGKTILIAVGGPGGTGKSTFSTELAEVLGDASVLRLDDYKTSRSLRKSLNIFGAHPQANEMELLVTHFELLSMGQSIRKPVYNSVTGEADTVEEFVPERFVVLDGEVSTYREFLPYIDFSIFVDADWRTQLRTRVSRDIEERNYDKDKAIATFLHSNLREFEEYGASSKNTADIHLYCESDYRLTLESMVEKLFQKYRLLLDGMYKRVGLRGFSLALLTPFASDGSVDKGAFVEHLQYLYQAGVHRVLVAGMTGEFYLLTESEKRELLAVASRYFPGHIIYNATALTLQGTCEQIMIAEDLGADGVCALPPLAPVGVLEKVMENYYNRLYEVAERSTLPLMIYNNPACCSNVISMSSLRRLPELFIKDSAGIADLEGVSEKYFCGSDKRIRSSLLAGGIGFISGAANASPEIYCRMEEAFFSGSKEAVKNGQVEIDNLLISLAAIDGISNRTLREKVRKYLPGYPVNSRMPY